MLVSVHKFVKASQGSLDDLRDLGENWFNCAG